MSIKLTNLLNRNYNLTRNTYIIHANKATSPWISSWESFMEKKKSFLQQGAISLLPHAAGLTNLPPFQVLTLCPSPSPHPLPRECGIVPGITDHPARRGGGIFDQSHKRASEPPLFPGPQPLRETLSSAVALRAAFQTRPRAFQTSKSAGSSQCRAELANAMCTGASDGCWLPSRFVFWRLTEIEWDTSDIQGLQEALKI